MPGINFERGRGKEKGEIPGKREEREKIGMVIRAKSVEPPSFKRDLGIRDKGQW